MIYEKKVNDYDWDAEFSKIVKERINYDMTYDLLMKLKDIGEADVIDTAYDGTCLLVKVKNISQNYVVLSDNTVITQFEDNTIGEPIFPWN